MARSLGRLLAATAAAALLTTTGCPSTADVSSNDGVDLAQGLGLDSGQWYFAPGIDQDTDSAAPFDYVTFEPVSAAVYGTLPSGASGPVYRLEVVNLLIDGSFEWEGNTTADGGAFADVAGAGWVSGDSDGGASSPNATLTTSSAIEGASLSLAFDDSTPYFAVDLPSALRDSSFSGNEAYAAHFDFQMGIRTFGVELHNNNSGAAQFSVLSETRVSGLPVDSSAVFVFPAVNGENPDRNDATATGNNTIRPESGLTHFSFGGFDTSSQPSPTVAVIDNVRFVRSDQNHHLRLPIPYNADGREAIAPGGTYTVRMWVRNDPTVGDTSSQTSANRHKARFLSAGIDPRYDDPAVVSKTSNAAATTRVYVGDLAGWRQLSFAVPGNSISPIGASDQDVILDLVIEIGHSAGGPIFRDAGSILIANVELLWSED